MSNIDLTRLVYRSILRWTKATTDVPFLLRNEHIQEVFPQFTSMNLRLEGSTAIRSMAQTSFRDNREMQDDDASEALDAAFTAMRLLNTHYSDIVRVMREHRELHLKKPDALYQVGQVFIHRRHGYVGVVYGWDPHCGRDQAWADKLHVKHDQPFYQVLPDEDDCQRLYGGIRITKYVAEENIMPLQVPRRITHRLLENFFTGYCLTRHRYLPTTQVQFQYPGDYELPDVVPCREDTDLLRVPANEANELPSPADHTMRTLQRE